MEDVTHYPNYTLPVTSVDKIEKLMMEWLRGSDG
jgi:hypothetical protein